MGELLGAVVCPHPPLLLRELNGQQDAIPDLRAACQHAVRTLIDWQPDRIVVIGRGPWSSRVARRLLDESGWLGATQWVPVTPAQLPGRIALLVMADGTASRTPKAPGYFDDRAASLDATIVQALRDGDPAALTGLDDSLADELRMQGAPALHALGTTIQAVAPQHIRAEVSYVDDPFGVFYVVATWQLTG